MRSAAELAHRIETGIETKEGRYDWASKVEVRAYVAKEVQGIRNAQESLGSEIIDLQKRITDPDFCMAVVKTVETIRHNEALVAEYKRREAWPRWRKWLHKARLNLKLRMGL